MEWIFKHIETYKINDEIIPLEYRQAYWALSITKQDELIQYWIIKALPEFEKGKKQYKIRKNARLIHGHYTHEIAILTDYLNSIREYSYGNDFFEIDKLKEKLFQKQVKNLNEFKELFINPFGGYQYETKSHKMKNLDEIHKDVLEFPITEDNVKISKWPTGNHYYVRVNGEDVVINNQQKWNTKKEATDAVKLYKNNLGETVWEKVDEKKSITD